MIQARESVARLYLLRITIFRPLGANWGYRRLTCCSNRVIPPCFFLPNIITHGISWNHISQSSMYLWPKLVISTCSLFCPLLQHWPDRPGTNWARIARAAAMSSWSRCLFWPPLGWMKTSGNGNSIGYPWWRILEIVGQSPDFPFAMKLLSC